MKGHVSKILTIGLLSIFCIAITSRAEVPAPTGVPVNQFLGVPDTTFNNLQEFDCRVCHGPNPPEGVPVDTTYLPDRHHALVGQDIPGSTAAPNPEVTTEYSCNTCHTLEGDFPNLQFAVFRDCTFCHTSNGEGNQFGDATVHHITPQAKNGDCVACHGTIVDNMDDGHRIPTYRISGITPWAANKPGTNTEDQPPAPGNCDYCHSPDYNFSSAPGSLVDNSTGAAVEVFSNGTNHHMTGFSTCSWCHPIGTFPDGSIGVIFGGPQQIRACEKCHGIASLHNIQVDGNSDGVVTAFGEPQWYGHIGTNADCNGCHFHVAPSMNSASETTVWGNAIPPVLDSMSDFVVDAEEVADLTLYGSSFADDAVVALVDADGAEQIVIPSGATDHTIEATLPALAAGNYKVTVRNGKEASAPKVLTFKTKTIIQRADIVGGTIVIKGKGFGMEPPMDNRLGVFVDGIAADVASWGDTAITAMVPEGATGEAAQLVSTYQASSAVTSTMPQPTEPPVDDDMDEEKGKSRNENADDKGDNRYDRGDNRSDRADEVRKERIERKYRSDKRDR